MTISFFIRTLTRDTSPSLSSATLPPTMAPHTWEQQYYGRQPSNNGQLYGGFQQQQQQQYMYPQQYGTVSLRHLLSSLPCGVSPPTLCHANQANNKEKNPALSRFFCCKVFESRSLPLWSRETGWQGVKDKTRDVS